MTRPTDKLKPATSTRPLAGILINNLGTPAKPTTSAVRRFLAEFLWDPRVVQIPRIIWWPILNFLILPFRSRQMAKNYDKIWTSEGSPLLAISKHQVKALTSALKGHLPDTCRVTLGMRYGEPSIASALNTLEDAGVNQLLVLPLYPQYSTTTTASTVDAVDASLEQMQWSPSLQTITDYHDDPGYIDAICNSIREYCDANGTPDQLLFSYHGIPVRLVKQGDPYESQCQETTRLVVRQLGLDDSRWLLAFQSRFGRDEWLKPAVSETLQQWGSQKMEHVAIVCPGFSADCLETLEEIELQNRALFIQAGGQRYGYIPALNSRPDHIAALVDLVKANLNV